MKKYNVPLNADLIYEVTVNAESEDDAKTIVRNNFLGYCILKPENSDTEYISKVNIWSDKELNVLKKFRLDYEIYAPSYKEADADFVEKFVDDSDYMIRHLRNSLIEVEDSGDIREYKVRINAVVDYDVIVDAENEEDAQSKAETCQEGPCTIKLKGSDKLYDGILQYVNNIDAITLMEND